jgi:hypothetical protein
MLKKFLPILFLFAGFQANAAIIDFETATTSSVGGSDNGNPYFEDGFELVAGTGSLFAFEDGWQDYRGSSNGTVVGGVYNGVVGASATLQITRTDGALFDLLSIDLAELFNDGDFAESAGSTVYVFTGWKTGPDAVNHIDLDGISDGLGGVGDFQTFNFGHDWTGLSGFSFSAHNPLDTLYGSYAAFDNMALEISSVPEPSIIALFGLGLVGVGFARRRQS